MSWKLVCAGVMTGLLAKIASEPSRARIQVINRWSRSVLSIPRLRLE
jgi:hypothetical protein